MGRRRWGLWIGWLTTLWLFIVFIASIVSYTRGIDVVAVLVALIAQLVIVIAWALFRPLPLWIVYFLGLIVLSAVVGLMITVPGGFVVSWLVIGLVPAGLAMLVAAFVATEREAALTH